MVKHISDRVAVLYLGTLVELTTSEELYANPQHPYTRALLSAIPIPDPKIEQERDAKKIRLEGEVPSPINPRQDASSREDVNAQCQSADRRCQSFVILAEVISLPVIFAIHQMDVRQENAYDTE